VTIYTFCDNLVYTKVSGHPVYPGMTWNSVLSILLVVIAYPFGIGLWYAIVWCSNKKLRYALQKKGISFSGEIEENDENLCSMNATLVRSVEA
jgi:hypothetical protein